MYYILYNLETKKVEHYDTNPLKEQNWNVYGKAQFDGELPKADWLTVDNIRLKTESWTEKEQVEKLDDSGQPIFNEQGEVVYEEIEVPKSRTYFICDLVANFRPAKTQQEIAKQKAQVRINVLKELLQDSDYQAIKYAEGWIAAEEYKQIKAQRQVWRDEINELEAL